MGHHYDDTDYCGCGRVGYCTPRCPEPPRCTCGHTQAEHYWKNRPPPISRARTLSCDAAGCACTRFTLQNLVTDAEP